MRILRLIFTCFLSLAILSVGSAAVAMSVNSPCPMMQKQAESAESDIAMASMSMMAMDMTSQNSMPDMDCMKAEKAHSSSMLHCKSGQDCVMYNVQLANPVSNIVVAQPKPQYLYSTQYVAQPSDFIPTPDLFGLWRPPRAL